MSFHICEHFPVQNHSALDVGKTSRGTHSSMILASMPVQRHAKLME